MIVGMPNVGKSTILNFLRKKSGKGGNVAKTGANPGVTRHVSAFKVSDKPLVFVTDTPGIMLPSNIGNEIGYKLAITGAIKDSILGEEILADYLLYTLNRFNALNYVKMFNLSEATENIDELLTAVAKRIGAKSHNGVWDFNLAARYLLSKYRSGDLGLLTLDDIQ